MTPEELKALITLCRAGKLYEVEKWIASGRPISAPPKTKKTPLYAAIEVGFHSLVELLVRHEESQAERNRALSEAVERRRLDLVELLIANGAEVRSVSLSEVLLSWDPEMIRYFLDNGADVVTGSPFAVAFGERIRTALRPFVDYKRTHSDVAVALQEQADRALRHFCYDGDMKWISLLLWAGANPRSRGPTLDDRWADDPDCYTTAFQEACSKGNLEVLAKLKLNPQTDNLSELLASVSGADSSEMLHHLLRLGANPNDKSNGGSSALDHCLWSLGYGTFEQLQTRRLSTKYDVSKTIDRIRELVEHGAVWKPNDRYALNQVRQALYKCEPVVTVDFVKLLARNKSCPEETLEQLLEVPRMKQHLSTLGIKLTGVTSRTR